MTFEELLNVGARIGLIVVCVVWFIGWRRSSENAQIAGTLLALPIVGWLAWSHGFGQIDKLAGADRSGQGTDGSAAAITRDRVHIAAECMRRALTEGLEQYPPAHFDIGAKERTELRTLLERNQAKKVEQGKACVSGLEAHHLGRLSFFLDVSAENCGMRESEPLRSRLHSEFGDTDLINGAALAYMGEVGKDGLPWGPFFVGQSAARIAFKATPDHSRSELCDTHWRDYGPTGLIFPGLIQRR